jgi:hypothetical protein
VKSDHKAHSIHTYRLHYQRRSTVPLPSIHPMLNNALLMLITKVNNLLLSSDLIFLFMRILLYFQGQLDHSLFFVVECKLKEISLLRKLSSTIRSGSFISAKSYFRSPFFRNSLGNLHYPWRISSHPRFGMFTRTMLAYFLGKDKYLQYKRWAQVRI